MKPKRIIVTLALAAVCFPMVFFLIAFVQQTDTEILELPDGYRVQCAIDEPAYSLWVPFLDGNGGFEDPNVYPSERDAILSAIRYEEFRRTPREKERDKYQWKDCKGGIE